MWTDTFSWATAYVGSTDPHNILSHLKKWIKFGVNYSVNTRLNT